MAKFLVSTPSYQHQVNNEMVLSLLRATQSLRDNNHSVNWHSPTSSILSFNRNLSVERAIKEHYDWLLFWDADISVEEPDFIEKMAELGHKTTADIIGLPVTLKGEPPTLNCAIKVGGEYKNLLKHDFERLERSVDVIGTGVMLIWVNLFKKMQPPYFTFTDTYKNEPGFFPEDWNFCEKASEYTKIMADPRFTVKHWGIKSYE